MSGAMQRFVKKSGILPLTGQSIRWPPVCRWFKHVLAWENDLQAWFLEQLDRWALRSGALQRFLIDRHERAFRALLPSLQHRPVHSVGIVGGGFFPRTVMVLRRLLPESRLVVVDASARNIDRARDYLERHDDGCTQVEFLKSRFDAIWHQDFDLIIIPLGFLGDRNKLYCEPVGPLVIVHDWLWRSRGQAGVVVSYLLLKRLNLVIRSEVTA